MISPTSANTLNRFVYISIERNEDQSRDDCKEQPLHVSILGT